MAKKNGSGGSTDVVVPGFKMPEQTGVNIAARYPQYDEGLDARIADNVGCKGAPLHGVILGRVELPSKQKDAAGNTKPWYAQVVKLMQPTLAVTADGEKIVAEPGTLVVVTESVAFQSMFARHNIDLSTLNEQTSVLEILFVPQVGRTADGSRSLWTFPYFEIRAIHPRKSSELMGLAGLSSLTATTPKQLTANGEETTL